jgi:hypothetical protein
MRIESNLKGETQHTASMQEIFGNTDGKLYLEYNPQGSLVPKRIPIDSACSVVLVTTNERTEASYTKN